jgi:PAS domain S-box-containing protein
VIDNPIPVNENERLKALDDYDILDTLSEHEFDRLTELASIICEVPISLVSLLDEHRQWFKSAVGLQVKETPRDLAFCRYTITDAQFLEVNDATHDIRFKHNELVTGSPDIRFYAGFPLIDPEGYALGTLCVIDRKPRTLNDQQKRALQLLAEEVIALIVERRKKQDLKNFEKLFKTSNDLVFVGGMDGFFKRVNPAFTKVLGWSERHLLTTSSFEFIHPDDIERTEAQLKNMLSGGDTTNFLQRMKTINGDYKTIEWTSAPEALTGNIFGIGRDVTAIVAKDKLLARTKEVLEQTNQVARVGGWEFNVRQQKIYWTSVTKEIHGVLPDFEPAFDSGVNFYKEGDSRDRIAKAINKAITEGTPWNEELQIIDAKGKEIWVRVLGNAEFENGVCKRLYGTFQDINDYKSAELALKKSIQTQEALNLALMKQVELVKEQDKTIDKIQEFKFLADSIPQIIWTSNPDGTMDYYNKHWFDFTGLSLDDTMFYGWEPVIHPDDAPKDYADWHESLATGKAYKSEVRFRRASDGIYKWHLSQAQPMYAADGKIIKWFGSCYDIDEYKRALDLENRISQYEDFNRIVAHNLRGPSGSIRMILTMIDDTADEHEKEELFQMLNQSSETLNETLNELMRVLEVRNSKNIAYDTCNLNEMVKVTSAMLRGQILEKKAIITADLNITTMQFPKMYLESIFYNMVSNSLKYSKPGVPPEILITSELINGHVTLTFSDNGLGIDLERHGKDMFKLNSVFHAGHDSKGIGLFMTKTQIETFGGKISVESKPNVGTKFTIVF